MSAAFDTLKYAKQLKQAGVPEEQAEIHAEALRGVLEEQIAARFDRVDDRFDRVDDQFDERFKQVDARFDQIDQRFKQVDARFADLENRFVRLEGRVNLVQWMVGFNLAVTLAVLWLLIRSAGLG